MDQFVGHWKLVKSDNFEAYLKAVNVSTLLRKVASRITTYEEIMQDSDNGWHLKLSSTFTRNTLTFQLGVAFKEITPSGHQMKTTITIEDDKWIQIQQADDPTAVDSKVTRRLLDPDNMIVTYEAADVVAHRTLIRYKP